MFGYAVPVDMTLSGEDAAAYRGYYCETCHQLRDCYGMMSAIIVSYEMTFASILLNSVSSDGVDVSEPKAGPLCVLRHASRRTDLLRKLAAYSVLVANNDLIDDRLDGATVKTNLGLLWMNRSIERARRDFPEYDRLIMDGYAKLREKESAGCSDPVEMGYASAASMVDVMRLMNGGEWTPVLERLFLNLGAWVYIMDAIDDLDEDHEKGQYNPFLAGAPEFNGARDFVTSNIYAISDAVRTVVGEIQSAYSELRPSMVRNTGICDNIVYQGIPTTVRLVMDGRSRMKPTLTDMIGGKVNRTIGSQF